MPSRQTWCAVLALAISLVSPALAHEESHLLDVKLVADRLEAPLDLTFAPDDSGRRFIVDQNGIVQILKEDDKILPTPFLNITDRVVVGTAFDERGLLAIAFHPNFATNKKLYAHYSGPRRDVDNICLDENGTIPVNKTHGCPHQHEKRIVEFTVSQDDPNVVDVSTERILLQMEWPTRKHNGGALAFGPDGYLYIGIGDGGWVHGPEGGGDPLNVPSDLHMGDNFAQDKTSLLGKILRIDVDGGVPYGIPPDNPLVGKTGKEEIFAWGFRNPWRLSFDSDDFGKTPVYTVGGTKSLNLYMSATAESFYEATYKVDGPGNYGWTVKEGSHCFVRSSADAPPETISCTSDGNECPSGPQVSTCGDNGKCTCAAEDDEEIHDPVIEYLNKLVDGYKDVPGTGLGRASLGGHVYRGTEIPWLKCHFVQGDFSANFGDGLLFVAEPKAGGKLPWDLELAYKFDGEDPQKKGFMKSIGKDGDGELYAITGDFTPSGAIKGRVWKIVDGSSGRLPSTDCRLEDVSVQDNGDTSGAINASWSIGRYVAALIALSVLCLN